MRHAWSYLLVVLIAAGAWLAFAQPTSRVAARTGDENEPLGRLVAHAGISSRCGVERWPVKTLTDPTARTIVWRPRPTTITQLVSLPAPASEPVDRQPGEKVVRTVKARVVAYKIEGDSDIHVVLEDAANPGTTMISEFPALWCTRGAQHRWAMEHARRAFLAATAGAPPNSSRFTEARLMSTVSGVVFFDRLHGQRGVAPNGVELHPVAGFRAG